MTIRKITAVIGICCLLLLSIGFAFAGGWGADSGQSAWASDCGSKSSWTGKMVQSYLALHTTLPDGGIEELRSRLMPGGYLYSTFGPGGQNKTVCDFVLMFKITGNLTTKSCTKTGETLRWDANNTAYVQNDLPTTTNGAGFLTVSTTDGWSGMTVLDLSSNPFTGNIPHLYNAGIINLTILYIQNTLFSGNIEIFSQLTDLVYLYFYNSLMSGNIANLSLLLDLEYLYGFSTIITGDIASLAPLVKLIVVSLYSTSVSGDVASLAPLTDLLSLHLYSTSVSAVSDYFVTVKLKTLRLEGLGLSETEVNRVLADYAQYTATLNMSNIYVINLGGSNVAPSAAGLADKLTIEGLAWDVGKDPIITVSTP